MELWAFVNPALKDVRSDVPPQGFSGGLPWSQDRTVRDCSSAGKPKEFEGNEGYQRVDFFFFWDRILLYLVPLSTGYDEEANRND